MANNVNTDSGGNSFLGFIVGGLLVLVVIFGVLYYNGTLGNGGGAGLSGGKSSTSISIEAPSPTKK